MSVKKLRRSYSGNEPSTRAFIAAAPHRVAIVVYPELSAFDALGTAELLSTANNQVRRDGRAAHDIYSVEVIAPTPGPVRLEMGIQLVPNRAMSDPPKPIDTLIISGGNREPVDAARKDPAFIGWLRATAPTCRRVVSMCTGAFLLAECGLVDRF